MAQGLQYQPQWSLGCNQDSTVVGTASLVPLEHEEGERNSVFNYKHLKGMQPRECVLTKRQNVKVDGRTYVRMPNWHTLLFGIQLSVDGPRRYPKQLCCTLLISLGQFQSFSDQA